MRLLLSIPIADLRPFFDSTPQPKGRLRKPQWPTPVAGAEFVRGFGPINTKPGTGTSSWRGENAFSNAWRAIRFDESPPFLVPVDPHRATRFDGTRIESGPESISTVPAQVTSRRVFADGRSIVKVEIEFRTARMRNPTTIDRLVAACSRSRVRVRENRGFKSTTLANAPSRLSEFYLEASTSRKPEPQTTDDWWTQARTPLLLVECDFDDVDRCADSRLVVLESDGSQVSLEHCYVPTVRGPAWRVWVVRRHPWTDDDLMKRIRVHLSRLHAEVEVLKVVLAALERSELPASDKLDEYCNSVHSLFTSQTRYGLPHSDLLRATIQNDALVDYDRPAVLEQLGVLHRGVETSLALEFERARAARIINQGDTVTNKWEINFGDNTTISGIVAAQIQGNVQMVAQSTASDELKDALATLNQQVVDVLGDIPEPEAEALTEDLDALTRAAASPAPQKDFYEFRANRLIKAAKTIGAIADPIITTVKAVLGLLN